MDNDFPIFAGPEPDDGYTSDSYAREACDTAHAMEAEGDDE